MPTPQRNALEADSFLVQDFSSMLFVILRQDSSGHSCAGIQCDAGERDDISYERRVCAESRGAGDLPKHVAILTAVDHENRRTAYGRERAPNFEDPDGIGVAPGVELE